MFPGDDGMPSYKSAYELFMNQYFRSGSRASCKSVADPVLIARRCNLQVADSANVVLLFALYCYINYFSLEGMKNCVGTSYSQTFRKYT